MLQASRVGCQRCPALCSSRKSIVDGIGPLDSPLMVVGDYPRREDDRAGNPFVGQDGQLLRGVITEICARLGVDSRRVFYTSAVRCRAKDQRPPTEDELDNCLSWLVEEIESVQPLVVLAVGSIAQDQVGAATELLNDNEWEWPLPVVKRAYHPSYILKNRSKLANWTNQIEIAIRRAFGLSEITPVVVDDGEWQFGQPDLSSQWLSADTEFDTLEEEYGSTPVGYSMSDGIVSNFYVGSAISDYHCGEPVNGLPHLYLHNIKADADHLGIDLHDLDSWDDTMIQAYVTRKFPMVGLKKLAPTLAGVDWGGVSIKDLLREYVPSGAVFKSGPRKGMDKPGKWKPVPFSRALAVRPDECRHYAATDAVATARIAQRLQPMLEADGGWADRYYRTFEKPLVPVLLGMERTGVRVDPDVLTAAGSVIDAARQRTEGELRKVFGSEIGINGDEIKPILLDMGLVDGKLTDSGDIGVAKGNILGAFRVEKIEDLPDTPEGQIARDLLEWRQMGKLKGTYVDSLLAKRDSEGRVHGRYNQAVTNTNRLSSSDPNLQNIPARSDIGIAIRKAFIPAEGCVFVGGDFSQLQLRVWAEFTKDPVFVNAYTLGGDKADFHQYAATALGRPRSIIKNFVFATVFGADEEKAAQTAGIPKPEVAAFMEQMRQDMPSLTTFKVAVSDTLAAQGYVESLMGWRGFFPDFWSPVTKWRSAAIREAVNFPVQSTEAGLVKATMVAIYANLREHWPAWRMVLQVHDELWCEGPPEQAQAIEAMMSETAVNVSKQWFRTVPIVFTTKTVANWAEGK